jgi:hypothetical protein
LKVGKIRQIVGGLEQLHHGSIRIVDHAEPAVPTLTILVPIPVSVTWNPNATPTFPARFRLVK